MEWLIPIAVAVIGGPLVVLIQIVRDFRKENHADHGKVMEAITEVHDDVKDLGKRFKKHLKWHDQQEESGGGGGESTVA